MAKKNRGPRQRSQQSLIALLHRRSSTEDHLALSLIYPGHSNKAVGVRCDCGKEHPLHSSAFRVNWEKEGVIIPPLPERKCSYCGAVIGEGITECYSCWLTTAGPFF